MMRKLRDRQITVGMTAGVLAGLVHAGLLAALNGFSAVASLGGSDNLVIGFVIHLLLSTFAGMAYTWLFNPPRPGAGEKPVSVQVQDPTRMFLNPDPSGLLSPDLSGRGTGSHAESLMSGLAYGLLWWILLSLNLLPIFSGEGPQWQVSAVVDAFPTLLGYLFQGAMVGLGYHFLSSVINPWLGPVEEPKVVLQRPMVQHRIVILGGGYAGVTTAQHLERRFARDDSVAITLISKTNHFLFTPMLSEVTAGGVEAQHISTPLRAFFDRTQVIGGEVKAVDFQARVVQLTPAEGRPHSEIPFDHLVLALGSVPTFFGQKSIEAYGFTFKSLEDAILIRNHVIQMLERADTETDAIQRKAMLTVVVAGGGFAGTELIGGLNDFVRGSLWYYPNIPAEDVSLILVHSRERILPELSTELGFYAREKMEARGVRFKLGARVADATPGEVKLNNGETIATETLIWTAGNSPHPLIRQMGLEVDKRGAVKTDTTLAVPDQSDVWAVGDCAAITDARTGEPCPPTAQHALREAAALAHNIHAAIRGGKLKSFSYRSLGSLAVLGHQTACAQLFGLKFSGLLAWWMWRTIYLAKLPTLEKKIRVALDWTIDLFFPRDIVQTFTFRKNGSLSKAEIQIKGDHR